MKARVQAAPFAAGLSALAVLLGAELAHAAPPAVARGGQGQPALGVGFDRKGVLRAKICAGAACSIEQGVDLGLPAELAGKAAESSFRVVRISDDRRAIVVTVPSGAPDRAWEAVVVAPLGGRAPAVLFSGYTGWVQGEDGLRHGPTVLVNEPDARGNRSILVGEQHEELTLCGRPTILAASVLDPRKLELVPAKVQRLPSDEREAAPEIEAQPVSGAAPEGPPLLTVVGATSALGEPPGVLTDGKLETAWSEARGGSGRGEFVVFRAPARLPLLGLEFVFKPSGPVPPGGTAPKELFVATSDRVIEVKVPPSAWQSPGARFSATFDGPLTVDCLALVLETAHDESAGAAVTIAEVRARTEFENADPQTLVGALAGGGKRAEAAGAVLRSLGRRGFEAVAQGFDKLDEGGRRVALDVIDSADCSISVPVYLRALGSDSEGHREHARPRLRRCGPAAAEALAAALPRAEGAAFGELAEELALLAPASALAAFLPLLEEKRPARRRALRVALGRLSQEPEAAPSIRAALVDPTLSETALLDLLRALGARVSAFVPEASRALARLAGRDESFRVRYLRTGPAAELAARDPAAGELLRGSITSDSSPHVRAQAARLVTTPELFQRELVRALSDPEMRVRAAAASALARPGGAFATPALLERLRQDRWPLVRAASALALAEFEPDTKVDGALGQALEDPSWLVRRDAASALGERGARGQAKRLLERLEDGEERFEVRVVAARALGDVCAADAAGALTAQVKKLADPLAPNETRAVGLAALGSLARLGLPDLRERLAPLFGEGSPSGTRAAAEAALKARPACR